MTWAPLAGAALVALAGPARAAPPGSPWGAAFFPDIPLVAQDGRPARFYSDLVEGKRVVINFIFTRCQAACPLETANLARVQERLAGRVGRDLFFYSITVDPEHDTPAALRAYAARFHAGPGWLFLTGRREDIERLRARLGDRAPWRNHGVGLALGNDPAGQWTSLSAMDHPGFLAATIAEWMATDPGSHPPVPSYASAPRVRLERGADLFRSRCAACHARPSAGPVGPDLAGVVQRRGRAWIARWLSDPEALLRDGDPAALSWVARDGRLTMPRFSLGEGELEDLLTFLERRAGDGPAAARGAGASAAGP